MGRVRDLDPRRHRQWHRSHAPGQVGGGDERGPLDPADPGARVQAAHEGDVDEPVGDDVVHEARAAAQDALVLAARERAADEHYAGTLEPTASRITRRAAIPSTAPVSTTASPRIAAPNSASSSASMSRGSKSTGSPFSVSVV